MSLATFKNVWVSRKEYKNEEVGSSIMHCGSIHSPTSCIQMNVFNVDGERQKMESCLEGSVG